MLRHADFPLFDFLPHAMVYRVVKVTRVEVGELVCDTLESVPDADLLRFSISSTEVRGEDQGTLEF